MQEMFGNAWVTMFKDVPNQTWIDALSQLTEKDINRGLNNIIRDGLDYPPNLPKFLNFCKPEIVEDVYKQERETYLMLENRRTIQRSSDVRKAEIAKMKSALRGVL